MTSITDVFFRDMEDRLTEWINLEVEKEAQARYNASHQDRVVLLIVFGVLLVFTIIRLIGVLMS